MTHTRLDFCVGFSVLSVLLATGPAFAAQELKVGFIEGRAVDMAVEKQAFNNAGVEYEVLKAEDYNLGRLLEFDVIGVGITAYDQNEGLKANFKVIKEYVESGGYLVILDFQQDSTWNEDFLPHPVALFDDDVDEGAGVEIIDHPMWNTPNEITEDHFVGWGAGDFMSDGPHEADPPWEPLLISNNWSIIIGAKAGNGYVVLNSLQTLCAAGSTGNNMIVEVLQNMLFWHGPLTIDAEGSLPITWGRIKAR